MRTTSLLAPLIVLASAGAATAAPEFDAASAWEHLRTQVEEIGPRAPGTAGHDSCRVWLRRTLDERADRVQVHSFEMDDPYSDRRLRLTNFRAMFRPELRSRIAIAAHWDTRPWADRDPDDPTAPLLGANDGGSGVAVLLALAEVLDREAPPVGVDLIFFDGEDYGREGDSENYLLGSRRFVADHPAYEPRALILLDMVGDRDLRIPYERYSISAAPQLARAVFSRAAALGLEAFVPVFGPAVLDDHVPFLQAGIPALDLIDFDYPPWHTLDDDLDACSQESLDQVGRLMVSLIYDGLGF